MIKKNMTLWLLLGAGAGLGAVYYFKKRKEGEIKAQAVAKVIAPKTPITSGIVPPLMVKSKSTGTVPFLAKLKKIGINPRRIRAPQAQSNYFSLG